jgi:hypothetical protein
MKLCETSYREVHPMAESFVAESDMSSVAARSTSEEHAAVQRVLASRPFAKAPLLSSFLMHASRRTLDDGMVRISEYEIGINVFQRRSDFDPRQDNIVRTYARYLRKRLQDYYETEGEGDPIRIEIPKGTYVPVFRTREMQIAKAEPAIRQPHPEEQAIHEELESRRPSGFPGSSGKRAWLLWPAVLLLAVYSVTLWWLAERTPHPITRAEHTSPSHTLWAQLFRHDQNTFVIPGDIGFVILQQANHRTFSLAEYLNWFSSESPDNHLAMSYLKDQTYTSVLNLEIVSNIQRLPEAIADRFLIRAAKNVRLDDLRDSNAILLGSSYSNPWDEIFSDQLNFHFISRPNDSRFWIVNEHPMGREASVYESTTTNTTHKTYAVVAFVRNLNKNGHILLLEGLDAAGTQAAADTVFNDDTQRIAGKDMSRYETLGSFELLIEVNSLDSNSHVTSSRIIASRFYN